VSGGELPAETRVQTSFAFRATRPVETSQREVSKPRRRDNDMYIGSGVLVLILIILLLIWLF
jgi:hypothetical protein